MRFSQPAFTLVSWDTWFSGSLENNCLYWSFSAWAPKVDFSCIHTSMSWVKPGHLKCACQSWSQSVLPIFLSCTYIRNVIVLIFLKLQSTFSLSFKNADNFPLTHCWVCVALGILDSLIIPEQHPWAASVLTAFLCSSLLSVPFSWQFHLSYFHVLFLLICINSLWT